MAWPVPANDTGIGAHSDPNAYHKPADPVAYADDLWNHGVRWFLLWIFDEGSADFAYALRRRGIEVILRSGPAWMPRPNIDVVSQIEAYTDVGVRWIVLGNEYNLFEEWSTENNWKSFDKPLRHVAEWYVRMARIVRERGAWPLTPPPSLGGHMLHREWFSRFMWALHNIADEQGVSMKSLLYPGGIGLHCRSVGNPLEAGPDWYDCSAREWEWFDAIVREHLDGESLPMANTEAFDEPQWIKPPIGAHYNWQLWKERNLEQMRWFNPDNEGYRYPIEVMCNCHWVIHADRFSPWPQCGLYSNYPHFIQRGDYTTDLWREMPGVIDWTRREGTMPQPPPPQPPTKLRVYDQHGDQQTLEWAQQKYGVRLDVYEGKGWHVTQMRERVNAAAAVEMFFYDEHGTPEYGLPVQFHWPGGCDCDKETEISGKVGFAYSSGGWIWDTTVGGPYWIELPEYYAADALSGLGMKAMTNHDHLDFVWKYGDIEEELPTDPLEVILPLAEDMLGAIPVPAEWAYPQKALEHGFLYQVGGYSQVDIKGQMWGYQTFTNDDQSEYGVAYSPEGEYDKTEWALLDRDG